MNDMCDSPVIRPVVMNAEAPPPTPKVTLWHWVKYYAFNLGRKWQVRKAQRELTAIAAGIQEALKLEVYPQLEKKIRDCEMCKDAYMTLRPQIFLSQIEMILKRMKCSSHATIFESFASRHESKFRESEKIARYINGFGER